MFFPFSQCSSAASLRSYSQVGKSLGLGRPPYFYVTGFSPITAVAELAPAVLAPNNGDDLAFRLAFLGQLPISHPQGALYTMLAVASVAFEREVLTFGVGTDMVQTRLAAARGLASIVPTAPVLRNGQALAFDTNGRMEGEVRVFTYDWERDQRNFASVLSDGNVAIYDFDVRDQLLRPTVQDYLRVQSEGLPSNDEDTNRFGTRASGSIAAVVILVILAVAAGGIWHRRNNAKGQPHYFGPELRALPIGNRPFEAPLELPFSCLRLGEEMGRGSFGQVLKGTLLVSDGPQWFCDKGLLQ